MLFWISLALAVEPPEFLVDPDVATIGSSLSHVGETRLRIQIALRSAEGWDGVEVGEITDAGYGLAHHHFDFLQGEGLYASLFSTPNRAIILHEAATIVGLDPSDSQWISGTAGAKGLDAQIAATGSDTVLLLPWGAQNGGFDEVRFPDYPTMQDHVTDGILGYHAEMTTNGREVWISPVGEGFRWIRDNMGTPEWEGLYSPDGEHPSFDGTGLVAAMHYAVLTGRDPADFEFSTKISWFLPAVDALVLDDPFGPYPYAFARMWDAADGEDVAIDFDGDVRPTVGLESAAVAGSIDIADGRLFLLDGADLVADVLTVVGELRVHEGAQLRVPVVTGDLRFEDGTYDGGGNVQGRFELAEPAVLRLVDGESLGVTDVATLSGTVQLDGPFTAGTHVLVSSPALVWEGTVLLPAADDMVLEVTGTEILLTVPEPGDTGTRIDPPTDATDTGDPIASKPKQTPNDPGCQCSSSAAGAPWLFGILGLLVARRRQR